jgi:cyclophilin family peptidyl-prolyl cis-trans isomerase
MNRAKNHIRGEPMMMFRQACFLAMTAGLVLGIGCQPDNQRAARPKRPRGTSHEQRTARVALETTFSRWKQMLGELRGLELAYYTADEAERDDLAERFRETRQEGRQLESELIQAAIRSLARQPDEDEELREFLTWVATFFFNTQQYEDALRIAQLLIENHIENRAVYETAARSAFACHEFPLAERYLEILTEEHGEIEPYADRLRSIPYYQKEWKRERQLRQAEALADDLPRVLLRTNRGEIELELFENEAPNTVANFISLVQQRFYDGATFHLVQPGIQAQSGRPQGTGEYGPGYTIPCECYRPERRLHFRGSLSMAHQQRDTGSSQFNLMFQPVRGRDGTHTVFGRIVRGLEVLAKLQPRGQDPFSQTIKPDWIIEAQVLRMRDHPYVPRTIPHAWGQQTQTEQAGRELSLTK